MTASRRKETAAEADAVLAAAVVSEVPAVDPVAGAEDAEAQEAVVAVEAVKFTRFFFVYKNIK